MSKDSEEEKRVCRTIERLKESLENLPHDKRFSVVMLTAVEDGGGEDESKTGYAQQLAWVNNKVPNAVVFDLVSKFLKALATDRPKLFLALMLSMPEIGLEGVRQAEKIRKSNAGLAASDELLDKAPEDELENINELINKMLGK